MVLMLLQFSEHVIASHLTGFYLQPFVGEVKITSFKFELSEIVAPLTRLQLCS